VSSDAFLPVEDDSKSFGGVAAAAIAASLVDTSMVAVRTEGGRE